MRLVSLAREVADPHGSIGRYLRQTFPNTAPVIEDFHTRMKGVRMLPLPSNAGPVPYSTLGLAIDYRIGYYFRVTYTRKLGAFDGARYLAGTSRLLDGPWSETVMRPVAEHIDYVKYPIPKLANAFFDRLELTVQSINPVGRRVTPDEERTLSRYCYVLALLDTRLTSLIRDADAWSHNPLSALKSGAGVEELLELARPEWVTDVCRMSWLFYERQASLLKQRAYVHPNIIKNHSLVGAEPDLIINGCVVDIKTTVDARLPSTWLYQVLAYALTDTANSWRIGGIGFYLARQATLIRWPLNALIPTLTDSRHSSLAELRKEFYEVLLGNQTRT